MNDQILDWLGGAAGVRMEADGGVYHADFWSAAPGEPEDLVIGFDDHTYIHLKDLRSARVVGRRSFVLEPEEAVYTVLYTGDDHRVGIPVKLNGRVIGVVESCTESRGVLNLSVRAGEIDLSSDNPAAESDLKEILRNVMRVLVTPEGLPDKPHRTKEQQEVFEQAKKAIK
jgi:hypothetical protein